ncbi:hypothetical protein [Acidaminococcus fermentans]|uniref:hypothetical protein n=1 Tax=Acidaminococcus fermentans TaxID=905 RepID=UPI00242FA299|nr:hypothetical protein [Acidaminococcus fermentans]MCI6285784.1 hypothetical protein [Acidaminococcus fermentans]
MTFFKIFAAVLLSCCSLLPHAWAAPDYLPQRQAAERARETFLMKGVDGGSYRVYVVGEGEELLGKKYLWAKNDQERNYKGNYSLYMARLGSKEMALRQPVELYHNRPVIVNPVDPSWNGFYVAKGIKGQPDILVLTQRESGGGGFRAETYFIRNGQLQQLWYLSPKGYIQKSKVIGFKKLRYRDDGTFALPTWTNRKPGGKIIIIYRLDVSRMLLEQIRVEKVLPIRK